MLISAIFSKLSAASASLEGPPSCAQVIVFIVSFLSIILGLVRRNNLLRSLRPESMVWVFWLVAAFAVNCEPNQYLTELVGVLAARPGKRVIAETLRMQFCIHSYSHPPAIVLYTSAHAIRTSNRLNRRGSHAGIWLQAGSSYVS